MRGRADTTYGSRRRILTPCEAYIVARWTVIHLAAVAVLTFAAAGDRLSTRCACGGDDG